MFRAETFSMQQIIVKYKLWTKVFKLEAKNRKYGNNNGKLPAIKFDPVEKSVLPSLFYTLWETRIYTRYNVYSINKLF